MYVNSKTITIIVNSWTKKAFRSNGSSYYGYREHAIDKLLEALEMIVVNIYLQFNGHIFKSSAYRCGEVS